MSEQPQPPDASALDESWMVASTPSIQQDSAYHDEPISPTPLARAERGRRLHRKDDTNTAKSTDSLASSWTMSGPELIMPSICEAPISEASWVAPVRSKDQTSSGTVRKRRKITASTDAPTGHRDAVDTSPKPTLSRSSSSIFRLKTLCRDQSTYVRTAINSLLLMLILHLLVIPEIIYQAQSLCNLRAIKTIYPPSCIHPHPRPFHPSKAIITPEETLTQAQTHLESIFTLTLDTLLPHAQTLPETESILAALQSQLTTTPPTARNALDLEFQGSDTALRAAISDFDSLRADLRSAMDSLLASPISQETSPPSIARDTRLAVQLRRRAEYLDRLRAQLGAKADSLLARFASLDDHLEAVEGIVLREQRGTLLSWGDSSGYERSLLQSILSFFGRDMPSGDSSKAQEDASSRPVSSLALLQSAAIRHHPIADAVSRLSRELASIPRARAGVR